MDGNEIKELQDLIGYTFNNKDLIIQALTHSSFCNEQLICKTGDYERLEFLGDAVLECVSSEFLYGSYPEKKEGELSKIRASMVCEPSLAFCARDIRLGEFIRLGRGEERTGGRERDSIISDVMEAIVGAIFLDGGFENARSFIHRFILSDLENKQLFFDSKSNLQEFVAKNLKKELEYVTEEESGENNEKVFTSKVVIGGETVAEGRGRSKKASQQEAAYNALLKLRSTDVS
ncbi:MAG: ribonuclease III [Lachnospiraceae bacterium]|nr:ribonuclease III [Lachnospiraceae bacterium]